MSHGSMPDDPRGASVTAGGGGRRFRTTFTARPDSQPSAPGMPAPNRVTSRRPGPVGTSRGNDGAATSHRGSPSSRRTPANADT